MRFALPISSRLLDQPQIGLMNQGRRLKRVARPFLVQVMRGQCTQLVIDQGHKTICRASIARLHGIKDFRGIRRHRGIPKKRWEAAATADKVGAQTIAISLARVMVIMAGPCRILERPTG